MQWRNLLPGREDRDVRILASITDERYVNVLPLFVVKKFNWAACVCLDAVLGCANVLPTINVNCETCSRTPTEAELESTLECVRGDHKCSSGITVRISGPARDALISKPTRPPAPLHAIVLALYIWINLQLPLR